MNKLIILDRDGVINYDSLHYIKSEDEFKLIPGSVDAIARLTSQGYQIAIATNQSGIARGYYDHNTLASIHNVLYTEVQNAGGQIDLIKYCPHMPDSGCEHRKPGAGMLLAIAEEFGVDIKGIPFVGDRISDIQAAETAGAKPYLVYSDMTDKKALTNYPHVPTFGSLTDCVDYLLASKHVD